MTEEAGPARRRRRQLTTAMDDAAGKEGEKPADEEDQAKTQAAANALAGKPAEHSLIHDKVNQHRRAIHSAAKHIDEDEQAASSEHASPAGDASEIQPVEEGEAAAAPAASEGEAGKEGEKAAESKEGGGVSAGAASPLPKQPSAPKEEEPMDERVLQVTIHGTEELKANINLVHPVIKLSIIDTEDEGKLMKKPRQGRNVVQQNENATTIEGNTSPRRDSTPNKDGNPSPMKSTGYDRILPVLTQPFDLSAQLRDGKQLKCEWEELIGLDERLAYFMNPRYVLFFELLDFVHSSEEMETVKVNTRSTFWKHIAWGFVRPNKGAEGYVRTGQRLRLQLYKYRKFWFWQQKPSSDPNACLAYQQWKAGQWKAYKSTLFVTIDGILRPENKLVENRSKMPWEKEEGLEDLAGQLKARQGREEARRRQWRTDDKVDKQRLGKKWIGSTGKWCRIPNVPMHKVESDHRGCFVLAFSAYGNFLACATGGRTMYRVKIYNVATGSLENTLPGHQEIVYDMQWGMETEESELNDDAGNAGGNAGAGGAEAGPGPLLLTASADTTAKVWSLASSAVMATCHHPSYCYSARFLPGPDGVRGDTPQEKAASACLYVLTGCYDTFLRLWDVRAETVGESGAAQIVKLIGGHSSHVNSVVTDHALTKAYSADGMGQIRVWSLQRHALECVKEINEPEIKGDAVNCLRLDKSGKRLVVLARDHCIRMLDVASDRCPIVQRFSGLRCSQHQIRCDLSPDGRWLMSGSEDGQVLVWNVDTGELDASTPKERMPRCTGMSTDVAWNPAERIVAVCSFSRRHPILLHKYERDLLASEEMEEDEVDTSGDGKLSLAEFREGMTKLELGSRITRHCASSRRPRRVQRRSTRTTSSSASGPQ
ncbi:WD40-repeat-containing domain protein, partial [Baffinella frigidus]